MDANSCEQQGSDFLLPNRNAALVRAGSSWQECAAGNLLLLLGEAVPAASPAGAQQDCRAAGHTPSPV